MQLPIRRAFRPPIPDPRPLLRCGTILGHLDLPPVDAPFDKLPADLPPDELRRRLACLLTLVEVTRDLAGQIGLDDTLHAVAQQACQALDCERASLFQFDKRREELFTRVATELEIDEIRTHINHGITGYVARTGQAANVVDPPADTRWNSNVDRATGFHTRNILAVPVVGGRGEQLVGVLELINKRGRPFDQFDEQLAQAFGQHAAVALDRAKLVEELRERHSTQASLEIAREIQRGFMPDKLPEIPDYQLASWWYPNEAVGGDYCDVTRMRDGRIGLIIADVSGHGLGPSLIMASVRAGLRALLLEHSSADVLLANVARSMFHDLRDGRFITMVFAALDAERHLLEFANAGHAPAMHFAAATGAFTMLEATGLPLGLLDEAAYQRGPQVSLAPGDLVVLCTDGIIEAMDEREEQFGMERLKEIISSNSQRPLGDLVHEIGAQVSAHYVGENPPDDLTVLALRRKQG